MRTKAILWFVVGLTIGVFTLIGAFVMITLLQHNSIEEIREMSLSEKIDTAKSQSCFFK